MASKNVDCSDISFNSGLYFVKYLKENKLVTAKNLLEYWKEKCGEREPIFRSKILLALKEDKYDNSLLTKGVLNNIFNYQNRVNFIKNSYYHQYDENISYFGFTPFAQKFDKSTQEIAKSVKKKYKPGSIEYLLAEFYGGKTDRILQNIKSKLYGNSMLIQELDKEAEKYSKLGEFHIALIKGLWIPTGYQRLLGLHPEIGFQIGSKKGSINRDFTIVFRFLQSENHYTAYRNDIPELTNYFFGGYIGYDLGKDIYAEKGHEIQFTGGIALDGLDILEEDKNKGLESETVFSYNFNFGIGYRYYISNSFYLGLKAKYNIINYSLGGKTNLSGNAFTIQLIIGSVNNKIRNENLKELGYKLRK